MNSPENQTVGLWVLERCPGHEKFPYRLTIVKHGPPQETFVMRVADRWPVGDQRIFCLREREQPPEDEVREEVERVPITALERIGRKLTVILDRPRLKRCDFLFLKRTYKHPTEDRATYEQIFWQTERAIRARRPRVRLAPTNTPHPLAIRIAHDERYPWTFPGAIVERGRLPCGDYALMDEDTPRAVVERKTFDNLLADFGVMDAFHQRLVELATYEHHALVIEARYEDFLNPKKVHHWSAAFCARAIADLYARHPRLRIVFVSNHKTANAWTRQFFEAVARKAEQAVGADALAAEAEEVLPPSAGRVQTASISSRGGARRNASKQRGGDDGTTM